jgi:hypothetical protein
VLVVSALPPAKLTYFLGQNAQKRFAGLINDEIYDLPPPSLPGPVH